MVRTIAGIPRQEDCKNKEQADKGLFFYALVCPNTFVI